MGLVVMVEVGVRGEGLHCQQVPTNMEVRVFVHACEKRSAGPQCDVLACGAPSRCGV